MTATITDDFKRQLSGNLKKTYDSGDTYYICVGRSEQWNNTDTPPGVSLQDNLQSISYSRQTRLSMQSAKRVFNLSYVIPRYNWQSGTIYQAYDDTVTDVTDNTKYYVITQLNQVYMCLRSGIDGAGNIIPSIVEPTGVSVNPFKTADGYFWKFMYTISVGDTDKYVTTKFMPVRYVDSAGPEDEATIIQQKSIQDAATPQQIVGYKVTNNGSASYVTPPTVTVVGNGTQAQARASIDDAGNLISVEVDSNGSGGWLFGTGYDYAEAIVDGLGECVPILGPPLGLGGDPTIDLRATRHMFNVRLINDETGTIIAGGQDFRQMALLKNPLIYNHVGDSAYTANTGIFLDGFKMSGLTGSFAIDDVITGTGIPTPRAVVDKYFDSAGIGYLTYHQNDSTGYSPFTGNMVVTSEGGASGTTLSSNREIFPDIDKFSGELIYIDNRTAVPRENVSQQDLKIVIRY